MRSPAPCATVRSSPRRRSAASAGTRSGFAKAYGPLLRALTGDEGARSLVAARKWALRLVDVDDPGVLRDVDRPDDLREG